MTSRNLYEAALIELHKENAPNILLEDFNYFANKSINNFINKRYNIYDINQQTTDDLRVLKSEAILIPTKVNSIYNDLTNSGNMATYEVTMPSDYLHILNCICVYNVKSTYKCYDKNTTCRFAATRLTADAYSQVLDNFWTKPSYKRPYYYIHNVNTSNELPTNPVKFDSTTHKYVSGTDSVSAIQLPDDTDSEDNSIVQGTGLPKFITINGDRVSNIERGQAIRYGNVSNVRLEIRYGTDDRIFELKSVYVDYIKTPQNIRLTQSELDTTEDTSQILEYPDYVCQEIVNELVHLIMENISDQRLQTHPVVSQSIANPAQAQAPEAAGKSA